MTGEVTTERGRDRVSASTLIDAPPEAVFDFVRRPANHPVISGDSTVKAPSGGPDALSLGDRFGMNMRNGLPYRVSNRVVEYEPDRRIAWCHFAGHRWRWEVEPDGDGRCRVTETFDMSTARVPAVLRLMGYPGAQATNVASSVANVAAHFAASGG